MARSQTAAQGVASAAARHPPQKVLKHRRRYCRHPGCTRIVKSQGLCQRHGAKPRKCKVENCEKQAQGNFDGMCKSHFKCMKRKTTPLPQPMPKSVPPPAPEGESVYDSVLPASIAYKHDDSNAEEKGVMPLVAHLKAGFDGGKPPAWHRNEERRARGLRVVSNPATQLEGWERELVWMEILVLTGNPDSSFRHLARAWGRDKGFHMVLAQFICERHGDVQRKKRHRNNSGTVVTKKERRTPMELLPDGGASAAGAEQGTNSEMVSANVWDDACYGNLDYNEALAAGIFEWSPHEFDIAASATSYASKKTRRAPMEMNPHGDGAAIMADEPNYHMQGHMHMQGRMQGNEQGHAQGHAQADENAAMFDPVHNHASSHIPYACI